MDSGQTQAAWRIPQTAAQIGASGFSEPDLSEIVYDGTPRTAEEIEAAFRVLRVRREIMERVCARRQVMGRQKRHLADAMQARGQFLKMRESGRRDAAVALELEGRIEESEAKAMACHEKALQYEMEIYTWMQTLKGGE